MCERGRFEVGQLVYIDLWPKPWARGVVAGVFPESQTDELAVVAWDRKHRKKTYLATLDRARFPSDIVATDARVWGGAVLRVPIKYLRLARPDSEPNKTLYADFLFEPPSAQGMEHRGWQPYWPSNEPSLQFVPFAAFLVDIHPKADSFGRCPSCRKGDTHNRKECYAPYKQRLKEFLCGRRDQVLGKGAILKTDADVLKVLKSAWPNRLSWGIDHFIGDARCFNGNSRKFWDTDVSLPMIQREGIAVERQAFMETIAFVTHAITTSCSEAQIEGMILNRFLGHA